MKVLVKCNLKYSFNFKPKILNLTSLDENLNNKIYCKNMFYFILFLEYFLKKNSFKNHKMYIQKDLKKNQAILRAPNKHKKAQVHLKIERYYLILSFNYEFVIEKINYKKLDMIVNKLNNSFWFFESSLVNLRTKRFFIKVPFRLIYEL